MSYVIIGDFRYPRTPIELLKKLLERERCTTLVILGDFLARFHREDRARISEVASVLGRVIRYGRRVGTSKVIYIVGARDDGVLLYRRKIIDELGGKAISIEIVPIKVISIENIVLVFEHGHRQFNVIFNEYYRKYSTTFEAIVNATRKARDLEEREGRLRKGAWWIIGHTQILHVDPEYRIIHSGLLAEDINYEGAGLRGSIIDVEPNEHRGYIVIKGTEVTLKKVNGSEVKRFKLT
ncbi:MAG: hypothetical protein DRJ40_03785 [Thermoprotei archaeon]|nr:MAG: hypothetical protein DRJ40_03785 [Thermoprotei archaeon]